MIEAEQQERVGKCFRNDRLVAAPTHAHTHEHIRSNENLPLHLLKVVQGFFAHYNQLRGKQFTSVGWGDADRTMKLLENGRKALAASPE